MRAWFITSTLLLIAIATAILGIGFVVISWPGSESEHDPRTMSEATWQQRMKALQSLPYVNIISAEGRNEVGVTLWDQTRTQPGYNLYCSRITNEIFLEDLQGRVIKKWAFPEGNPSPEELAKRVQGAAQ